MFTFTTFNDFPPKKSFGHHASYRKHSRRTIFIEESERILSEKSRSFAHEIHRNNLMLTFVGSRIPVVPTSDSEVLSIAK